MSNYEEALGELGTGDLVLFAGTTKFSRSIRLLTGGAYSHVGVVVRTPDFDGQVLLWESTRLMDERVQDVEHGGVFEGVQLLSLAERIEHYEGKGAVRRLVPEIDAAMDAALTQRRGELARRPFERSRLELLRAAYDGPFGDSAGERLESLFCAELVAEAYQAMGLLQEASEGGLPSNEYTPADFAAQRDLQLLRGYRLGPERILKP